MMRNSFGAARHCDITRSEVSWQTRPEANRDSYRGLVCMLSGEKTRPLLLAGQGDQPKIKFLKPCVFAHGIDLAKDRSIIDRAVGVCAVRVRPQPIHLQQCVGDLKLPLPSLGLQQRIAAYLDRETSANDILISEKEPMFGLLEEKRQALVSYARQAE